MKNSNTCHPITNIYIGREHQVLGMCLTIYLYIYMYIDVYEFIDIYAFTHR